MVSQSAGSVGSDRWREPCRAASRRCNVELHGVESPRQRPWKGLEFGGMVKSTEVRTHPEELGLGSAHASQDEYPP